jgi:LPXTG-motif cell wall-anchored protein
MDQLIALGILILGVALWVVFFRKEKSTPPVPEDQGPDTTLPVKGGGEVLNEKTLGKMTKVQLEEHARANGIELDRRKTKANMISDYMLELRK